MTGKEAFRKTKGETRTEKDMDMDINKNTNANEAEAFARTGGEDKLDVIFKLQNMLDEDIRTRRGLAFSTEEWMQKEVLAMLSELSEVLDEVNFKWWKNKKPLDAEALRGELVDILHFFVSMCLHAGMDADMLFSKYLEKNKENFDRQYGRSDRRGYAVEDGADGV